MGQILGRSKDGDSDFDPTVVFVYRGGRAPRDVVRVRIHRSVRVIPEGAFEDCRDLESVEFHEGLVRIGDYSFCGCSSLESLRIASSVTQIGNYAFNGCTGLKSVELHEGLRKIGNGAFWGCSLLSSLHIPSSVTVICICAFKHCKGLESVKFNDGLEKIGEGAFCGCSSLGSLSVPSSVAGIGGDAFEDCLNLVSVELHDGLRAVGRHVFRGCTSLERIRFPRLTRRMEALALDGELVTELENRMDEISLVVIGGSSNWEQCRESLGRFDDFLTCLEQAVPLMEMTLWKMKIEVEPRLSRKECCVKCGAEIVTKEVAPFFLWEHCREFERTATIDNSEHNHRRTC